MRFSLGFLVRLAQALLRQPVEGTLRQPAAPIPPAHPRRRHTNTYDDAA